MRKHFLFCLLIFGLGFLVYANSLNNHFQFDDYRMLEGIKTAPSLKGFFSLRPTSRMITGLSYFFNYHYRLSRTSIFEFHLVNIFIHILTAILIYWIVFLLTTDYTVKVRGVKPRGGHATFRGTHGALRTDKDDADFADKDADYADKTARTPHPAPRTPPPTSHFPFFTALLFLVHPLCTEPVNYIVARSVLLATMFSFLTLLLFIFWKKGKSPSVNSGLMNISPSVNSLRRTQGLNPLKTGLMNRSPFYLWGTFFSFFFAGYSKEIGFYYSLVMVFLYYWIFYLSNESPTKKKKVYLVFVLLLLLFGFFALRYTVVSGRLTFYGLGKTWEYFLVENKVFFDYLRLLIFPFIGLNVDHHQPMTKGIFDFSLLPYLFVNLLLLGVIYFLFKRNRLIFFALLWLYFLLLPYFFIPTVELMVEYRVYPAIFGYGLFLSFFLERIISNEKLRRFVSVGMIISFFLATFLRNRVWQDPLTLWEDAVKKSPNKARVHCNLGVASHLFGNYAKAIEELSRAIVLDPGAIVPRSELGSVYRAKGERGKAIEEYKKAVELEDLQGVKTKIYLNLGDTYAEEEKTAEAIEAYNNALKLNPAYFDAYYNLGLLYYQEKDYRQAIKNLEKAVEIQPMNTDTLNILGIVYDLAGEYLLAIDAYKRALAIKPKFAEAWYNLGISYENSNLADEALRAYQEALKINPHYAKAYNNLGNVYYKKGNDEEAIKNYKKAISFAPDLIEAYNNLGTVYSERKMYPEAREIFREALKIDPKNRVAEKNLEQILGKITK